MSFIEDIKERARKDIKTILLPEAEELRTLEATRMVLDEKFAKVILIGNKEKVLKKAKENDIDISDVEIIDPTNSSKYDDISAEILSISEYLMNISSKEFILSEKDVILSRTAKKI